MHCVVDPIDRDAFSLGKDGFFCAMSFFVVDKDMEEKALSALGTAQKKIKLEIQDLSERVKLAREATQKLKEQIEQAESIDNG